ncbi:MAG: GGDEF domain-containing protein [Proteobacteria bacterium]|nr:GGDEF domain-containing protein [Pseudomonadota bacterium]
MKRKLFPTPDLDWYIRISDRRDTALRCPFATVDQCPRYYQSLHLLGHAGSTKIPEKEDARLTEKWEKSDLWPRTDEYCTSLSGPKDHRYPSSFSNFCPETLYDRFGYFVTHLSKYHDEEDQAALHRRLEKDNAPAGHPLWSWGGASPQHFTECYLYPILSRRGESSSSRPDKRELEQKFGILFSHGQIDRDFVQWTLEAQGLADYKIAALFIDIDDFKSLNSKYTESVVDRTILSEIQVLVRSWSLHRGAAYRFGGEELVVLMPNCSDRQAKGFGESLLKKISDHEFLVDGHSIKITASIGVALWPTHGTLSEDVIKAANEAEHRAKADGKNCVRIAG